MSNQFPQQGNQGGQGNQGPQGNQGGNPQYRPPGDYQQGQQQPGQFGGQGQQHQPQGNFGQGQNPPQGNFGQGQNPPQGNFGQQGGQFNQQGGGPYGPRGGGGAPKPKSNGMIIGIVVAAIAALALGGLLIMQLLGPKQPDPNPTISPTVNPSTAPPSPGPTTSPDPSTSPDPDPSPSSSPNPPSGDSEEIGLKVSVTPADDWKVVNRNETKNYLELSNGKALLATQAFQVKGSPSATSICDSYADQLKEDLSGFRKGTTKKLNLNNDAVDGGVTSFQGTRATSQGSVKLTYIAIFSVRQDGLTIMSTLIMPSSVSVESVQDDYLGMTESIIDSQVSA